MFDLYTLFQAALLAIGVAAIGLGLTAAFTTTEPDIGEEEKGARWAQASHFVLVGVVFLVVLRLTQ